MFECLLWSCVCSQGNVLLDLKTNLGTSGNSDTDSVECQEVYLSYQHILALDRRSYLFYISCLCGVFLTTVQPQHCIQQTLEMVLPETATTNPSTTQLKRLYNQRSLSAVSYRTFPSKRMEEKQKHGSYAFPWNVGGARCGNQSSNVFLQQRSYHNKLSCTCLPYSCL